MLKLKELDLGVREKIDVLVTDVAEAETKTKKPYVIFTVTDGEIVTRIKKWDCRAVEYENAKNCVVEMNVKASMYGSEITYDTDFAKYSDKPVSDFIRKVPEDSEEMYHFIIQRVHAFSDKDLSEFVVSLLEKYEKKLKYWAAAKRQHHALYGGLLYHMYRMGRNADAQCDVYLNLNRELLIAGAFLHDIGKLVELDTNVLGNADYTTKGQLFGHLYIGMEMLEKHNTGASHALPDATLMHLKHMIASHHGRTEWGALVEPQTAEAQMLHYLDMIDSRMYMFEDAYRNMDHDSFVKTSNGHIYKF